MAMQPESALAPVQYAPTLLGASVFATGLLLGIAVTIAARWGARQGGRARAVAAAAGQLIVVRTADDRWEPLAIPTRFESMFTAPPRAGRPLPSWRPAIAGALAAVATRADATLAGATSADCVVDGLRLRIAAGRLGEGGDLLVTVTEAGADAARLNQFEAAALLSGGLAHDLLNVLNTVCLHAATAAMKPGTPAAVLVHLDRVRAGGQRAADLVSLLRRQLRADGRSASLPVPVSIADAVREMVELLRPAFPRGMVVDLALAADAFVVTSEPVQVHQVVLNWCSTRRRRSRGTRRRGCASRSTRRRARRGARRCWWSRTTGPACRPTCARAASTRTTARAWSGAARGSGSPSCACSSSTRCTATCAWTRRRRRRALHGAPAGGGGRAPGRAVGRRAERGRGSAGLTASAARAARRARPSHPPRVRPAPACRRRRARARWGTRCRDHRHARPPLDAPPPPARHPRARRARLPRRARRRGRARHRRRRARRPPRPSRPRPPARPRRGCARSTATCGCRSSAASPRTWTRSTCRCTRATTCACSRRRG
jgi:hypothetical protein